MLLEYGLNHISVLLKPIPRGTIEPHFSAFEGYDIAYPVSALCKPHQSRFFARLIIHLAGKINTMFEGASGLSVCAHLVA